MVSIRYFLYRNHHVLRCDFGNSFTSDTMTSVMGSKIKLPFDWDKCFVPDRSIDCMPACIAMAVRFWKTVRPELPFPSSLDDWKKFISEQESMTSRGTSITRLVDNLRRLNSNVQSEISLNIEPLTLINAESMEEFLKHDPPIPLIVVFDRSYTITNVEGGYHASLLYGIDYEKQKKVYLIDPSSVDLMESFPWDLDRFSLGWEKFQNLCFAVYPNDMNPIQSKSGVKSKSLFQFEEDE